MPYVTIVLPNGQSQRAYIPGNEDQSARRPVGNNPNPYSRLARSSFFGNTGGGSSGGGSQSSGSGAGGPGPNSGVGGSNTVTTEGGTEFVDPGEADFSAIMAPAVDFASAWDFAQGVGEENKETYYSNLQDPRGKDIALGFVDTDVEGIKRGANALAPFVREQGDIDTQKNIERAGKIDTFNFSRLPAFNRFNRSEVAANNEFNRGERLKAVQSSGLNYKKRVTDVLDQLATQSTGSLSDPLLDTLMTRTARDRGADIANSSGVGGRSGAGGDIQDKLDVNQRVALALDAQKTIPSILTQAQGVLASPEERAPTLFNSPTNVPLNVSNVADRIPVTSSISAGAAQNAIGTTATNYQVIPAATALGAQLGAQQFNATGQFQRDALVTGAEQAQMGASDSALQSALNQERADAAAQAGLDQRRQSEMISAGGQIIGGLVSGAFSTPIGGGQSAGGAVVGAIADGITSMFGGGGGSLTEGPGAPSPTLDFGGGGGFVGGSSDGGGGGGIDNVETSGDSGNFDLGQPQLDFDSGGGGGGGGFTLDGGFNDSVDIAQTFRETALPVSDPQMDARLARSATTSVSNWPKMNGGEQLSASSDVAMQTLEKKNYITPQNAQAVNAVISGLSTIANPHATDAQKATALASTTLKVGFPGDVRATNANAALQAFNILNSKASDEQKLTALTSVGISTAAANEIISQVAAGNAGAGLAVFNTASNWDKMDPVHQAAAVMQTSHAVMNSFSGIASEYAGSEFAATMASPTAAGLSTVLAGGAAVAGIGLGIKQAADVIDAAKDMPRSQSVGFATQGSSLAGAAIGAGVGAGLIATGAAAGSFVPIVGTAIGAGIGALAGVAIGMTGSGKGSGQLMRDGWRKGLVASGIVQRGKDNSYNVSLADGSSYDIGKDGGAKLRNADGTERRTFDVDWNDPNAVNAIPDAHIFAIATGLDPTSQEDFDTFHRVVAQTVNGATSNANTAEGVRNNVKAMMADKIDPRQLGMRFEMLRVSNKISEQEYGVYIDRVNKMFGTKLTPTDRTKSKNAIIDELKSQPKLDKMGKQLLELLMNPEKEAEAQKRLEERMRQDAADITTK